MYSICSILLSELITFVGISFEYADFRALSEVFSEQFDIVICMDNALPHMLSKDALEAAVKSITNQIVPGGMFVASIRDYDALLQEKPPYSPPYIHKTAKGQRVSFQTWVWNDEHYKLTQYIIDDEDTLQVNKFDCAYRATRREELTSLLMANGCSEVVWKFPEETGFYQPIVIAKK
jgi:2-polyprenyl-3-methyl-5-hydroxy-6-metoxy-1,4-benzoquinol methylase